MKEIKILVADDEDILRKLVVDFLKKDGYIVIEANNGKEALNILQNTDDLSLAILDVMMPEINGYNVCKQAKEFTNIPILILTAKAEDDDQINAFNSGADDYMSKPFSFPVLLLRIKALLKRNNVSTITEYKNIKIDENSHTVTIDDENIELTPKEYELLLFFIRNKNIVMSREQILSSVWNYDYYGDPRTIDAHIKNLRMKIKDDGTLIRTIRGYGYKME